MENTTASVCRIPLTGKHGRGKFALIDAVDYARVTPFSWNLTHQGRVRKGTTITGRKSVQTLLHRLILNAPSGVLVDHINGDPLDNRRCNLRLCTHHQNMMNRHTVNSSSGFKGVRKRVYGQNKDRVTYAARIKVAYQEIELGYFKTPEEAARAYDKAAREYFGEFAKTNFPD